MDSKPFVKANLSLISTPIDLPTDVYKFMVKNATSHQRSKLMEVRKFFYPKEFVKIRSADIDRNGIKCFIWEKDGTRKDVTAKLSQSLWMAMKLSIHESTDDVIRSLPKTAVWNLPILEIHQQVMSYQTFKYLTSGDVSMVKMTDTQTQYSDNNTEVPLEKIFELLPDIFSLYFNGNAPSIVSLESANAHRPSGLNFIFLYQLDEKFDFKTFSTFMINNQNIYYRISFKNGISEVYAKELKSIIAKINQAWNDQAKLPVFL